MNRMTSDNTFEMNMTQRALNQVYVGKGGWAQYVEQPDREYSACDLIRTSAETLGVEMPILGDEALSDLLLDWLQYGTEEPEGILAILYRALYAMAALRAKLYRYEDTGLGPEDIDALQKREQGLAELLVNVSCGCTVSYTRLAELAQAEKDGRLEILPPNAPTLLALAAVRAERQRQNALWGDQSGRSPFEWASILGEEYGELCEAVNETCCKNPAHPDRGGYENIIKEATQVAAVAVQIIEAACRRRPEAGNEG